MQHQESLSAQAPHRVPKPRNDFISILLRHKTAFLSAFFGTLLLAILALIVIQTRYVATGSVIVAEPEIGLEAQAPSGADKLGDPADMESQILLIKAARVLRLAVETPEAQSAILRECQARGSSKLFGIIPLGADASCTGDVKTNDKLLEQIQQHYSISAVGRSRVINISYDSPIAEVAQAMANALTNAFLGDRRAAAIHNREEAANWLKQQLVQLQASLKEDEDRIQAFRRKNGLVKGGVAPISSERLSSASQSLTLAESARAEALARLNEVKKAKSSGLTDLPTVIASRTVGDLKQQMATIAGQIASNAATLGPKHPSLIALQQEQDSLRRRLDQEMNSIAASAQRNFDAANATVSSLRQQLGKVQSDAGTASDDEASIADLVRDAEIKRTQYTELTKKVGDLETQKRVLAGSTRLVSLAELPIIPFFPKKIPFLAGGLTLGALLGFALAMMLDRKDQGLRSAAALSSGTGFPVIAELPLLRSNRRSLSNMVAGQTDLPLSEALTSAKTDAGFLAAMDGVFASLRAKGMPKNVQSVLISSAAPQEGRTFTALALAQTAALAGRRVLVMECDFQRPVFAKMFNLADSEGLAGVLRKKIKPQEAIFATDTANLFVIPAGQAVVSSSDLLAGDNLDAVLLWAKRFDLVILDSSPALSKPDARLIAGSVDAVIYCARWGSADVSDVSAIVRDMQTAGGHVVGVVMTMVDTARKGLYEKRPSSAPVFARAS